MKTTPFTVTGMTCAHCESAITAEVTAIPGVSSVEVSASEGTLLVHTAEALDDAQVLTAVAEAGYTALRS